MNDLVSVIRRCPLTWLNVPILDWLPEYSKDKFHKDLTAGVTVFVFMVPQGMAYAILAGMPPVYGLYSSIVPLYLYAMLGTSRQLSIGPMAITSLLLGVSCQKFGFDDESPEYIQIAMNVSMLVGLITLFLGMFRMGMLANLISHSVLVGFLTASSLIIAINQLKYIFGIDMPRFAYVHQTLWYLITHIQETNVAAFLLGFLSWLVLILIREWKKKYKANAESTWYGRCNRAMYVVANMSSFLVILFGSLVARIIIQSGGSVSIVGTIPSGLLAPGFAFIPLPSLLHIFPTSLAIAFVAFAGNWAVTRKYSIQYNYDVDATQELLGEGFTIIVGVLFNSFVVSGGLARSAVNAEAGAVTQMSGVITASFILLAVLTLTSFLYYIPMPSLAAVIEVSIISMLDFKSMRNAYDVDKRDCLVMVATFLFTFFIGVTEGLFAGMFLSIAVIMRSTAFPSVVHLGRLPSGSHFKNIKRFPEAEQIPGVAIIRMDASLFFGNCGHFKQAVKNAAHGVHHSMNTSIHTVVVDASAWIDIDLAGIQALFELKDELMKQYNVHFRIACAKGQIRDRLRSVHFVGNQGGDGVGVGVGGGKGLGGDDHLYFSIEDAIDGRPGRKSFWAGEEVDSSSGFVRLNEGEDKGESSRESSGRISVGNNSEDQSGNKGSARTAAVAKTEVRSPLFELRSWVDKAGYKKVGTEDGKVFSVNDCSDHGEVPEESPFF